MMISGHEVLVADGLGGGQTLEPDPWDQNPTLLSSSRETLDKCPYFSGRGVAISEFYRLNQLHHAQKHLIPGTEELANSYWVNNNKEDLLGGQVNNKIDVQASLLLGIRVNYVAHCAFPIDICVLSFAGQMNEFHTSRQLPFGPESNSTSDWSLTLQMCPLVLRGARQTRNRHIINTNWGERKQK